MVEGTRLLLDRTFDAGGLNYGNRRIFGIDLEPIPTPTALSLLALQGNADHPRVRASVAYLCRQADTGDDLEHLCWARIALDLYRDMDGVPAALTRSPSASRRPTKPVPPPPTFDQPRCVRL